MPTLTVAAARRVVESEIALGAGARPALPIISRASPGDPAGLPRPWALERTSTPERASSAMRSSARGDRVARAAELPSTAGPRAPVG
jgi:hypothetical protein